MIELMSWLASETTVHVWVLVACIWGGGMANYWIGWMAGRYGQDREARE
jgi:hypothetical protein